MKPAFRWAVAWMALTLFFRPLPAVAQTGTIVGTVRVAGPVPSPVSIHPSVDQEVCGASLPSASVQVGDGSALAQVVVSVEGIPGNSEPGEVVIKNAGCLFIPAITATTVGSRLVVVNEDPMMHNTHVSLRMGERARTMGNWSLTRKGVTIRNEQALRYAGVLEVKCDVHAWMEGAIRVFDHPYFAVTGMDGSFEITGVPPGTHTVSVWHLKLGLARKEVEVVPGARVVVDFALDGGTPDP